MAKIRLVMFPVLSWRNSLLFSWHSSNLKTNFLHDLGEAWLVPVKTLLENFAEPWMQGATVSNVSQEGMLSQTCGRRKDLKVAQLAFWVQYFKMQKWLNGAAKILESKGMIIGCLRTLFQTFLCDRTLVRFKLRYRLRVALTTEKIHFVFVNSTATAIQVDIAET